MHDIALAWSDDCSLHMDTTGIAWLTGALLVGSQIVWWTAWSEWLDIDMGMHAGQQCLELGCGTGLVSMCLHLSGASSVVATDGNAAAVDNCSHNFAQNDIPHQRGHALRMPGQVCMHWVHVSALTAFAPAQQAGC